MAMRIDHVVLWVADPLASVDWYVRVLGAEGVRVDEHRNGKTMFPSVRLAPDQLIDLMPMKLAPAMNGMAAGSAGNKVNHVCFAMAKDEYDALRARLTETGTKLITLEDNFGAQGIAPEAFYFTDPDGNVLEARYYG